GGKTNSKFDDFEYDDEGSQYSKDTYRSDNLKAVLYNNDQLDSIDYDMIAAVVK
ncbi:hypothetical protein SARC_14658, partial [Sphaeroforma arctica JP610]